MADWYWWLLLGAAVGAVFELNQISKTLAFYLPKILLTLRDLKAFLAPDDPEE